MVKKEKQIIENANETTVDLTLQEPETPTEVTLDASAKPKTRKTKSTTTKKTKAAKEPKEIVKEVVKIVTPEVYLQVAGFEFSSASFVDQAREAWVASGHDENEISNKRQHRN